MAGNDPDGGRDHEQGNVGAFEFAITNGLQQTRAYLAQEKPNHPVVTVGTTMANYIQQHTTDFTSDEIIQAARILMVVASMAGGILIDNGGDLHPAAILNIISIVAEKMHTDAELSRLESN